MVVLNLLVGLVVLLLEADQLVMQVLLIRVVMVY